MSANFPSTNFYTLGDLDYNVRQQAFEFNSALLDLLSTRTLSTIKNAFNRGVLVWQNGLCYIKVSELSHLLRTGNSGAHNYFWQQGIEGYVSPSLPHSIDGDIYISGPDFCGLLDARISSSFGVSNLYLRYVRAVYQAITTSTILVDLRVAFLDNIDGKRNQLKDQRVTRYGITCCEFSGIAFLKLSEVQFAHVESVTTSPLQALNIDNGVVILREIHAELTRLGVHDFAGMYDYCQQNSYSTEWADYYEL
ncbi:hypothetical protein [Pseudomonas fluorescens]|uniref:hypothetical protein n=1 Tax=Pseudomonas fluorescens TaxID=294 RepID=UPI0009C6BEC2|nr:hypothetical protein [Pseudomonas fluorescens]OPB21768.1 hypothetical protein BFW90_20575 [Pseudomonas fluorescens]